MNDYLSEVQDMLNETVRRKFEDRMQSAIITILTMGSISGLCLAGCETSNFVNQLIAGTFGMCLFAGCMYWLSKVLRG